jgi:predicted ester cyclase
MSLDENKAIARRHYEELWAKGNLDVADEIYSPAAVGHLRNEPDQLGYPECEKALVGADRVAFPGGTVTVEDQIAEGDKVLTRWRFRGTNTGEFLGAPPTGREISVSGTHIHRIVDGKIVEIWAQPDAFTFMSQLGLISAPAPVEVA